MSSLEQQYRAMFELFLSPVARQLEAHLKDSLSHLPRIDRISARPKSVDRFIQKATKMENGNPRYSDPLGQIQDQLGARIVTFYASDVSRIAGEVRRFFHPIENRLRVPETESEFGYIGEHFILLIPSDVRVGVEVVEDSPTVFELQIKTLFQHAWAEAEHDIGYKPNEELTALHRRKMAFTAAQAWGADQIFDELFKELGTDQA
jgi:ppGpp synthetase/RelA/SpoT-type nucleotidyltranferase